MYNLEHEVTPVITKDQNPEISLAVIDLKGVNKRTKNPTKTVYICTKGEVTFAVGEEKDMSFVKLDKGKFITINPNTPYFDFSLEGATLVAVSRTAFDLNDVTELDIPQKIDYMLAGFNKKQNFEF